MNVIKAESNTTLRIHCTGHKTPTAQALLGQAFRKSQLRPESVSSKFYAYEFRGFVMHNTSTVSLNLLAGTSAAAAGTPIINQGDGQDWEGENGIVMNRLRAILIEDDEKSSAAPRDLTVTLTNGAVIPIPYGGHLFIQAPDGKAISAAWHTIILKTSVIGTGSSYKVTALGEAYD
jgi:hypothetical protein